MCSTAPLPGPADSAGSPSLGSRSAHKCCPMCTGRGEQRADSATFCMRWNRLHLSDIFAGCVPSGTTQPDSSFKNRTKQNSHQGVVRQERERANDETTLAKIIRVKDIYLSMYLSISIIKPNREPLDVEIRYLYLISYEYRASRSYLCGVLDLLSSK